MSWARISVVGLGVVLAGCAPVALPHPGPDAPPPGMTVEDGFTIADVVFLQQMIPHHQLALRMSDMAITRASSPGIKALARQLTSDLGEVRQMSGWLLSLGIDPGLAGGGGHNHDGGPTAQDLANLANLSGVAFDGSFRDLIMRHSLGAIELAHAEVKQGSNAGTRRLAAQIATRESNRVITVGRIR